MWNGPSHGEWRVVQRDCHIDTRTLLSNQANIYNIRSSTRLQHYATDFGEKYSPLYR